MPGTVEEESKEGATKQQQKQRTPSGNKHAERGDHDQKVLVAPAGFAQQQQSAMMDMGMGMNPMMMYMPAPTNQPVSLLPAPIGMPMMYPQPVSGVSLLPAPTAAAHPPSKRGGHNQQQQQRHGNNKKDDGQHRSQAPAAKAAAAEGKESKENKENKEERPPPSDVREAQANANHSLTTIVFHHIPLEKSTQIAIYKELQRYEGLSNWEMDNRHGKLLVFAQFYSHANALKVLQSSGLLFGDRKVVVRWVDRWSKERPTKWDYAVAPKRSASDIQRAKRQQQQVVAAVAAATKATTQASTPAGAAKKAAATPAASAATTAKPAAPQSSSKQAAQQVKRKATETELENVKKYKQVVDHLVKNIEGIDALARSMDTATLATKLGKLEKLLAVAEEGLFCAAPAGQAGDNDARIKALKARLGPVKRNYEAFARDPAAFIQQHSTKNKPKQTPAKPAAQSTATPAKPKPRPKGKQAPQGGSNSPGWQAQPPSFVVHDLPPALRSEAALKKHFAHGPPVAVVYSADKNSARLDFMTRTVAEQARAKHRFHQGVPLNIEFLQPKSTAAPTPAKPQPATPAATATTATTTTATTTKPE